MKNPSLILLLLMAVIAVLGFVSYSYWDWQAGLIFLFAGGIFGGSVLIFKKEINLWINKRTGKSLSDKEIGYLVDHFAMLDRIPVNQHATFYQKVYLFCLDKEIISQDPEERIYHPALLLCGAYAAFFDMKNMQVRVPFPSIPVYVFYGHPFPSPQFPQRLHISEYYEEDGALLFSVPHMIKGNEDPKRFLNILLYESAKVAMNGYFELVDFPSISRLCKHGGFTIQKMEEYLGLSIEDICVKALALTQYFADDHRFHNTFPRLGELFQKEFTYRES